MIACLLGYSGQELPIQEPLFLELLSQEPLSRGLFSRILFKEPSCRNPHPGTIYTETTRPEPLVQELAV
jgi:hypothetical protein